MPYPVSAGFEIGIGRAKKKIPDHSEPIVKKESTPVAPTVVTADPSSTEVASVPPQQVKPLPNPVVKQTGNKLDKLRQMISEGKAEEKTEAPIVTEQATETGEENSDPLTEDNLNTFWQLYIAQLENQGKRSLSVIYKNSSVRAENDNTAMLTLSSQHEKEMFEEDRMNVIPFLRSRLNNFKLEIEVTVNSTIQKTRIFTAEEKFNAMAEKNPLLNDLRNKLGLELEY